MSSPKWLSDEKMAEHFGQEWYDVAQDVDAVNNFLESSKQKMRVIAMRYRGDVEWQVIDL